MGNKNDPLPPEDQMAIHQAVSRTPLIFHNNQLVPEDISTAESLLEQVAPGRNDLKERLTAIFEKTAKSIIPASPPTEPVQHKKFFMIDPHEITLGLPQNFRANDFSKWGTITNLIKTAGGEVLTARGADESGGTREVFTRDRYAVIDGIAYLPDITEYNRQLIDSGYTPEKAKEKTASYQGEIQQAETFLKSQGVKTQKVEGAWFEGGNIIPDRQSNTIFMGLETDTDNSMSLRKLMDAVNRNAKTESTRYEAFGVPLVNQGIYYHLDLGMSDPLPQRGEMMISPHVTDNQTLQAIKDRIGKGRVIELNPDEPVGTTNLVAPTKDHLILTTATDERKNDLRKRGYQIVENPSMIDLSLAAGGVRCMANEIPARLPSP